MAQEAARLAKTFIGRHLVQTIHLFPRLEWFNRSHFTTSSATFLQVRRDRCLLVRTTASGAEGMSPYRDG